MILTSDSNCPAWVHIARIGAVGLGQAPQQLPTTANGNNNAKIHQELQFSGN